MKINCTTIEKILKPQLYKGVIIQQSNSTEVKPQKKKEGVEDEGSSVKTGFRFFQYFMFQYCGSI